MTFVNTVNTSCLRCMYVGFLDSARRWRDDVPFVNLAGHIFFDYISLPGVCLLYPQLSDRACVCASVCLQFFVSFSQKEIVLFPLCEVRSGGHKDGQMDAIK